MDDVLEVLCCAQREVVELQKVQLLDFDGEDRTKAICRKHQSALSLLQRSCATLYRMASQWDAYDAAHTEINKRRALANASLSAMSLCFGKWMLFCAVKARQRRRVEDRAVAAAALVVRERCERLNSERAVQRYNLTQQASQLSTHILLSNFWRKWYAFAVSRRISNAGRRDMIMAYRLAGVLNKERLMRIVVGKWYKRLCKRIVASQSLACQDVASEAEDVRRAADTELRSMGGKIQSMEERNAQLLQALEAEKSESARLQREMNLMRSENQLLRSQVQGMERAKNQTAFEVGRLSAKHAEWTNTVYSCLLERLSAQANLLVTHTTDHVRIRNGFQTMFQQWRWWAEMRCLRRRLNQSEAEVYALQKVKQTEQAMLLRRADAELGNLHTHFRDLLEGNAFSNVVHRSALNANAINPEEDNDTVLPSRVWSVENVLVNAMGWSLQFDELRFRRELEGEAFDRFQSLCNFFTKGLAVMSISSARSLSNEATILRKLLQTQSSLRQKEFIRFYFIAWRAASVLTKARSKQQKTAMQIQTRLSQVKNSFRGLRSLFHDNRQSFVAHLSETVTTTTSIWDSSIALKEKALLSAWFHFWILSTQRRARFALEKEMAELRLHCKELECVIARALENHRSDISFQKDVRDDSVCPSDAFRDHSPIVSTEANVCDGMLLFSQGVNHNIASAGAAIANANEVVERVNDLALNGSVEDDVRRIADQVRDLMHEMHYDTLHSGVSEDF